MCAFMQVGGGWGIQQYNRVFDKRYVPGFMDPFKIITILAGICYYTYDKHKWDLSFRRFANNLTGKNKRTSIQFQWEDGTLLKLEPKDFINSCMFYDQNNKINPYWQENPNKLKCPRTPMEFLFKQGFIDRTRVSEKDFEIKTESFYETIENAVINVQVYGKIK